MAVPPVNASTDKTTSQLRSDSVYSSPTVDEVKNCELVPTIDSDSALVVQDIRSIYHIYNKKERHCNISPVIDASKERYYGPTVKEQKAKRKQKKSQAIRSANSLTNGATKPIKPESNGSFFLHTPYLSFHNPPRVLYIGHDKLETPVVLIHSKFLWTHYKLQTGAAIATPRLLDPRGVVCWRHNGGDEKALKADGKKLKGYKVKNWRLWGETGKDFVHRIKAQRKANVKPDPDVFEDEAAIMKSAVCADEVVFLRWTSALSRNTRQYHFEYAGIDFFWKGTGTVRETRRFGAWCRYNHLKLVARLPAAKEEAGPQPEVCLGKYTSSIAMKKYGTLELFDEAIWRFMSEYMPSGLPCQSQDEVLDISTRVAIVKETWLYRIIISTAMCMVIGEKQKREVVRKIVETLIADGAVGGAGG